ncbi:hypothetical protein X769_23755 [Mesorhizobium sp. LSJC268A00]|nr:hypothetical protein X769_23755 [Mesorhizobium sp. LSJC268A00]
MVYGTLSAMPSARLCLGRLQQALVDSGGLERRKCYGRTAASILLQQALVDSGGLERRKCYGRTAASILGLRN